MSSKVSNDKVRSELKAVLDEVSGLLDTLKDNDAAYPLQAIDDELVKLTEILKRNKSTTTL